MIDAKLLTARRGRVDLRPTTLALAAGRHALLGRREDGTSLLLACFAGDVRPRRGEVRVLGGAPSSAAVRARVGWVPLEVSLPDVLRVDEAIALARSIRKNASVSAASVLEPLGLEGLARRRIDSLDAGEARAVALAEALASPSVHVVLIEEPFVSMAPSAAAALPAALAAKKGACVVVATASASDAARVAEDFALFDDGKLIRIVTDAPLRTRGARARVQIVATDVRALAAALAERTEVEHLELGGGAVVVEGADPDALAAAINAAIVDAGAVVQRIEPEPSTLEELKEDALAKSSKPPAAEAAADTRGAP